MQVLQRPPRALLLEELFMPIDWRNSVTEDYVPYQLYDSLQAIASSICGLLASREALVSMGVSRSDATVQSAWFLNIASEASSRLLTIWFSWRYASRFDSECKRFRFLADLFNDSGMMLSTLSSSLPQPLQGIAVVAASCLRALCGVCAGSTKAALTNHFAKSEASVGDVNAKDGSQETVIYLIGLALGSVIVPQVQSRLGIWCLLVLLIAVHLWMNWKACRSVRLRSLNPQRLALVKAVYKETGKLMTLAEVAQHEAVLGTGPRPWAYSCSSQSDLKPLTSHAMQTSDGLVMMETGYQLMDLIEALFALDGLACPSSDSFTLQGWLLNHDALAFDGLEYKRTD